jgi:glutamate synthase (NADPH/NADH) large chain
MTAGRAVVLGDPGPWLCSGMTGGTVYCHLDPEMGLDRDALRRRLARGARVEIRELAEEDVAAIGELLLVYHRELLHSYQTDEADWVELTLSHCRRRFVKIVPEGAAIRPPVATE